MDRFWSWLPEILAACLSLAALGLLVRAARGSRAGWAARAGLCVLAAWVVAGLLLTPLRATRWWPGWSWLEWLRGGAPLAASGAIAALALQAVWRRTARYNPRRRALLRAATGALASGPPAAFAFGIVLERLNIRGVEADLPAPDLPADLVGLRIVQLTDIHLGPFLSERELARAVALANEFRPHLAVVTGDLISARRGPLEACLRALAGLRADAGVLGCHGNHEIYAGVEALTTRLGAQKGLDFLRNDFRLLRFGGAALNVVGVDYQRRGQRYLREAGKLVRRDAVNLLLSHNPDVFPVAADLGFQFILAGHTHGGQVNVEILGENLNVARFWTPYVYGLYRSPQAAIFVSRGLGTVGIPMRLGAPPEVVCVRLCRVASRAHRAAQAPEQNNSCDT